MAQVTWKGLKWQDIRTVAKQHDINARQPRANMVAQLKGKGVIPDHVKVVEIKRVKEEFLEKEGEMSEGEMPKIKNRLLDSVKKTEPTAVAKPAPTETDDQKRARLLSELADMGDGPVAEGKSYSLGPNYWTMPNNELRLLARSHGILTGMKPRGSQATFVENDRSAIIAALQQQDLSQGMVAHPESAVQPVPDAILLTRVLADPLNKDCIEIKDSGGNILCKCLRMGLADENRGRTILPMDEVANIIVNAINETVNQQQGLATV